jgi:hypothetical protein
MTLRVVGAGLGRTGTHSLKIALEQLLGGPCYHMIETFSRPQHLPMWTAAMLDEPVDWDLLFDGFVATVDWPGGGVWEQILAANPDALVLLSTRTDADAWWTSASRTIFQAIDIDGDEPPAPMLRVMLHRLTPDFPDEAACKAAYDDHNAHVRATVPADRLVDWQATDGWGPLCAALGVAEPSEPFPLTNTTADFRAMTGLDPAPSP